MVELSTGVTFETSNGGSLLILTPAALSEFGIEDGAAFFDDVHLNPTVPMTTKVGDDYDVEATVQHVTGDEAVTFGLTSRQPNGTTDVQITGLKPEGWYRLRFDGVLAETGAGRAHGQANTRGILQFNGVHVPYE